MLSLSIPLAFQWTELFQNYPNQRANCMQVREQKLEINDMIWVCLGTGV